MGEAAAALGLQALQCTHLPNLRLQLLLLCGVALLLALVGLVGRLEARQLRAHGRSVVGAWVARVSAEGTWARCGGGMGDQRASWEHIEHMGRGGVVGGMGRQRVSCWQKQGG